MWELVSRLVYYTRSFLRRIRRRDAMRLDYDRADHDHQSSLPSATLRHAVCCTEALAGAEVKIDHRYNATLGKRT